MNYSIPQEQQGNYGVYEQKNLSQVQPVDIVQPIPVQVLPQQPTPVQVLPQQPTPVQVLPQQPIPVQVLPQQPMQNTSYYPQTNIPANSSLQVCNSILTDSQFYVTATMGNECPGASKICVYPCDYYGYLDQSAIPITVFLQFYLYFSHTSSNPTAIEFLEDSLITRFIVFIQMTVEVFLQHI